MINTSANHGQSCDNNNTQRFAYNALYEELKLIQISRNYRIPGKTFSLATIASLLLFILYTIFIIQPEHDTTGYLFAM